jgi:hypothetical protein
MRDGFKQFFLRVSADNVDTTTPAAHILVDSERTVKIGVENVTSHLPFLLELTAYHVRLCLWAHLFLVYQPNLYLDHHHQTLKDIWPR